MNHPIFNNGPVYSTLAYNIVLLIQQINHNKDDMLPIILSPNNGQFIISAINKSKINMQIDISSEFIIMNNGKVASVAFKNINLDKPTTERFNNNVESLKNTLIQNINELNNTELGIVLIHTNNEIVYEYPQVGIIPFKIKFEGPSFN
jgi:hypothetical protein